MVSSGVEALGTDFGATATAGKQVMNKFGASSAFKAVMIASGGLSGGLSSAIAGGDFWKGVREGLITAGLNHALHLVLDNINSNKLTFRDFELDDKGNVISEKLVYFKRTGKDKALYEKAISEPMKKGVVSIYGHGSYYSFNWLGSFEPVDALFLEDSIMYSNFVKNGGSLVMDLKSCNTGKFSSDGDYSLSQNLTKMRSSLVIHSPAGAWYPNGTVENNAGYNMFIDGANVGWDRNR